MSYCADAEVIPVSDLNVCHIPFYNYHQMLNYFIHKKTVKVTEHFYVIRACFHRQC